MNEITVRGARLHNLKNVSLTIPKGKLVVLTGVSGSGKSTLGFDILHKEGQRQYIEALGLAPFGLTKPPVDSIAGLSPSISIDQHLTNRSPRSTVGTATDVYTYLRVLFARLGHRAHPRQLRGLRRDNRGEGEDERSGKSVRHGPSHRQFRGRGPTPAKCGNATAARRQSTRAGCGLSQVLQMNTRRRFRTFLLGVLAATLGACHFHGGCCHDWGYSHCAPRHSHCR